MVEGGVQCPNSRRRRRDRGEGFQLEFDWYLYAHARRASSTLRRGNSWGRGVGRVGTKVEQTSHTAGKHDRSSEIYGARYVVPDLELPASCRVELRSRMC